jgi:hypothetical protein
MGLTNLVIPGQEEDQLGSHVGEVVGVVLSVLTQGDQSLIRVHINEPESCKIEELWFKGYTPVISGNMIRARIPRFFDDGSYFTPSREIHRDKLRPYRARERAIQIERLSDDNFIARIRVLRTDRSSDYNQCPR